MQHIPILKMRNLLGTQRLLYLLMILTSGSTCSTGRPGLRMKTWGTIKEVSGEVFGKIFLIPQSLIVAMFQRPKDFIFILFLASSWGKNGEIVSCAHYKY